MFERTEHRDEEHVDERAYKFFSYYTDGRRGGYHHGWNSMVEGLRATTTIDSGSLHVCAYCGRIALPIQKSEYNHRRGEDEYISKGSCCVCKEAMDELEMIDQINVIKKQMEIAIGNCWAAMPATNPEVLLALVDRRAEETKKTLKFWNDRGSISPHTVETAGFKLAGPRYEKGEYEE